MRDRAAAIAVLALAFGSAGCRGCTSSRPPIHINPSMDEQPKYRAQAPSAFFYDGSAMRQPVPGTVARGELREDRAFFEGKDETGKDVAVSPVAVSDEVLTRGQNRYKIYCQPCHDQGGDGKGILFQKGNVPTTSMHSDKVLTATDGHIYDVITNGLGLMPGYKWPIAPADRWAIVAYVRQMQKTRREEQPAAASAPSPAAAAATPAAPAPSPSPKEAAK